MNEWWLESFGNPCRSCGFGWDLTVEEAVATVMRSPNWFERALSSSDGSQRHPDLGWSAKAYVFHVADNLSIWSERLAACAAGADGPIAQYDDNLLAEARGYDVMPLEGALWSLGVATATWHECVYASLELDLVLHHPTRGSLQVSDIVRSNCHDTVHHQWDVLRIVDAV